MYNQKRNAPLFPLALASRVGGFDKAEEPEAKIEIVDLRSTVVS